MATLCFNGSSHKLTLIDSKGNQVGSWHANNIVDHKATMRFVPNRTYRIIDPHRPHQHGGPEDTLNGAYGRFGIIRLEEFSIDGRAHNGVGVHSGRANMGAADHPTMGCIRTTDAAMAAITSHMRMDSIGTIHVVHNHDQHHVQKGRTGDHHSLRGVPAAKTREVRSTPGQVHR